MVDITEETNIQIKQSEHYITFLLLLFLLQAPIINTEQMNSYHAKICWFDLFCHLDAGVNSRFVFYSE